MTTNHIAASRTDEVRNGKVPRHENNSCAKTDGARATYVLADAGIDGSRWHVIDEVQEGDCRARDTLVCACGHEVIRWKADDVREEKPAELSGNNICYNCSNEVSDR